MADNVILAIETACEQCAVALCREDTIHIAREEEPSQHSRRLVSLTQGLLQSAGVGPDAISLLVWSAGPGSFTGLRAAASFCQALSWVHRMPVLGISTLQAIAKAAVLEHNLPEDAYIAVAVDARMGDVYFGHYRNSADTFAVASDQLIPVSQAALWLESVNTEVFLVGDGWNMPGLQDVRKGIRVEPGKVMPQALVSLACATPANMWENNPSQIRPHYLRGASHWKKRELLARKEI